KKTGIKRRASPSAVSREGFTRSSTVVYPVFVSNLTSLLRERLPARRVLRACPVFRHQTSIRIFHHSSSRMPIILAAFSVNFTTRVEIRRFTKLNERLVTRPRSRARDLQRRNNSLRLSSRLTLIPLEVFDLAETLFGLFFCFVRAA